MSKKASRKNLLTVPEKITGPEKIYLTGNEYLSLPRIDPAGGIESLNVIRLDHRGLLEFCGDGETPFLSPVLVIDGKEENFVGDADWRYDLDWIPTFSRSDKDGRVLEGEIVTPPGHKGFYYRLTLKNKSEKPISARLGWRGCWKSFNFIVFNRRPVEGRRSIDFSRWTGSLVLEASSGLPLSALALAVEPEVEWHFDEKGGSFWAEHELNLDPGEHYETVLYAAVNLEADGAATTTVDLRRHGQTPLKNKTENWLENRRVQANAGYLGEVLNKNLFFSYFYSLGRSLDNEELVPVTSRSPRYYVSAAYWSRDTLLWSFPAIMIADQDTARELLLAVFHRYIENAGDHALYINGTGLYPGFELDQLSAYFLALKHYIHISGDKAIIEKDIIRSGLDRLTEKALDCFDPESGLYATFLDPSDDPAVYPFLTYNNVLLQRAFLFLAGLQASEHWFHRSDFAVLAKELQQAIFDHCMVKGPFGPMFAWAVDGKGRFYLYDNPPGSLQLLAHYGFCTVDETVFTNTVRWIRSTNNEHYHLESRFEEAGSHHAANPWPLSACSDLLACNLGAVDFFSRVEMDNGFFCETIDPETGAVSTGAAFASAAGFLAYALTNRMSEDACLEQEPENQEVEES